MIGRGGMVPQDGREAAAAAAAAPVGDRPCLTVVVADDEPGVLELLAHILSAVADRVVTARDGEAAWEAIRAHRPAVAILDVDMPRRNGLALAALVRATPEL